MAIILSMVLAISILQGANGETCSLSDYDLNLDGLRLKDNSWYATINSEDCITTPATGENCVIYFTVCDELPKDVCNSTGSGMCMRVQNAASPPAVSNRYELGKTTDKFNATRLKNGFTADYSTDVHNPDCNGTTLVAADFQCSIHAVWSTNRLDVTKYLVEFSPILDEPCLYTAVFNYSGACVQAVPVEPTICNLPHYDASTLKVQNPWRVDLSGGMCYDPQKKSGTSCQLFISFCNVLSNIYCADSMFCESLSHGENEALSFGQFNSTFKYQEDPNGEGFVGNMLNGTKTDKCPDGLTATINFVCDKSAVWGSSNITQYVVAHPNYNDCQFQLTVKYSGACGTPFTPSPSPAPNTNPPSPVGWILMGLFVAGVLAYFLVGSVIQFARGRRGLEVIPNYDFWKQFPILVVGGFKFVIDKVTCYSVKNIGSGGPKVTEYDKL